MDDIRFADIMQRERDRLSREREDIVNQQKDPKTSSLRLITNSRRSMPMRRRKPGRRQGSVDNPVLREKVVRRSRNCQWILALARGPVPGGKPY